MKSGLLLSILLMMSGIPFLSPAQEFKFKADLDPFISLPGAYKLTPDILDEMFPKGRMNMNPYFAWLTQDKSRAIFKRRPAGNVLVDLTMLGGTIPVQEMIVDFEGERFIGITVSIFNRGDAGRLDRDQFQLYFKSMGKHLGQQLATSHRRRQGNIKRGILTSGYTWISARGMAVLEYNPGVMSENKNIEFLRMRLCQRNAKGSYAAAMQERSAATVKTSALPNNVKKDATSGSVYVDRIPMVDQGGKGYCVVASVQRLFEYYGVPCDMHQLAEIAGADPQRGTSSFETNKQLGAIDYLFKMRYSSLGMMSARGELREVEDPERGYLGDKVELKDFDKMIRKYIDEGIPLLWSLELGLFAEDPPISKQASGGHMRLITGYNDKDQRILFSDSWGAGHERKSMKISDAYQATRGIFLMKPTTN